MAKYRPRKLTRAEKILVSSQGLNPKEYLALDDMGDTLHIVHRTSNESVTIDPKTKRRK